MNLNGNNRPEIATFVLVAPDSGLLPKHDSTVVDRFDHLILKTELHDFGSTRERGRTRWIPISVQPITWTMLDPFHTCYLPFKQRKSRFNE